MLFNSIDFAVFLPIVFLLYWFGTRGNRRYQNILIFISSYVFYGWWDWRFLSLILFSTVVDYTVGLGLDKFKKKTTRRWLLLVSVCVNIGFLGFFKYYNFFLENFISAFSFLGMPIQAGTLDIVLPVGISFYTFQTMSYTIDIYKEKFSPTRNFIAFGAFVSFFPQLVAGPIERAKNLLPQFESDRTFDYRGAVIGMRQILWGLFMKIVIADNCAEYANLIFNNSGDFAGSTLVVGALFFTFQIYGDFAGYSNIAIGTARLFGFELMKNFDYPYFSRDVAEFWRRWHISLSTWFRDYLYIPLGGSRGGTWMKVRNTFVIFVVSGFWHGASWTFIAWGALNAVYFLPLLLADKNRKYLDIVAKDKVLPTLRELVSMGGTFFLTVIAWVFFRAESLSHALSYLAGMFSVSTLTIPVFPNETGALITVVFVLILLLFEWIGREEDFAIARIDHWPKTYRYLLYHAIVIVIILYGGTQQEFIYFQF